MRFVLCFVVAMATATTANAQVCVNGVCAVPSRVSMQQFYAEPIRIVSSPVVMSMAPQDLPATTVVAYAPREASVTTVAGCPCVQADGVCACATPSVMRSAPASYRVVYHGTSNRPLMRAVRYGVARPVGRLVRAPFRLLGRCCR